MGCITDVNIVRKTLTFATHCCNTLLQHTATHTFQANRCITDVHIVRKTLTAATHCCNILLQRPAATHCCTTLQHRTLAMGFISCVNRACKTLITTTATRSYNKLLQHATATCCSTQLRQWGASAASVACARHSLLNTLLQHTPQHTATTHNCNTFLQYALATHCNTLQHTT